MQIRWRPRVLHVVSVREEHVASDIAEQHTEAISQAPSYANCCFLSRLSYSSRVIHLRNVLSFMSRCNELPAPGACRAGRGTPTCTRVPSPSPSARSLEEAGLRGAMGVCSLTPAYAHWERAEQEAGLGAEDNQDLG